MRQPRGIASIRGKGGRRVTMATELNLSATQFMILVIILTLALAVLWLKKSYFQLDIEPKTDTVTDNTTRNVGTRYGAYIQSQGKYNN